MIAGPCFFADPAGGGPADPSFASVQLLCHMDTDSFDGTYYRTPDSSSFARLVERSSSNGVRPTVSTAQAKFGGASMDFAVATGNGRAESSNAAGWDFAAAPFTVEGWFRYASAPGSSMVCLIARWGSLGTRSWFLGHQSGSLKFFWSSNGSAFSTISVAWTPTLNTWYHIAVDRDAGGTLRLYIGGVVQASTALGSTSFYDNARGLTIGNSLADTTLIFPGYIDEVRVTKGVARYGGAFTPPTEAFPNA